MIAMHIADRIDCDHSTDKCNDDDHQYRKTIHQHLGCFRYVRAEMLNPDDQKRLHDGQQFVVTKGLAKGDVIIARGAGLVKEGTNVISSK